ncbi:hypothetical protein GCM10010331_35850 [Streptomyces xanthochromogenes]|nr:hypothetical protein GCM10010331_35850 [Streptomyces xanthochromogenes]
MSTAELRSVSGPDPDEARLEAGRAAASAPDEAALAGERPGEPALEAAAAPTSEGAGRLGDGAVSSGEGVASSGQRAAPAGGGNAPSGGSAVPPGDGAAPAGEAVASSGENAASSGGGAAPAGGGNAPSGEAAVPSGEAAASSEESAAPSTSRLRRALTLVCVLVLLLGGAGLLFQARQLTTTPATANRALTDASDTTRVIGDVSNTLGKVFSYAAQDTSATEQAAKELLGGRAATQYAALFGELRQRAADQKLSLTTHVVRAGVTRLTHDRAELLVFLDQRAQRDKSAATTAAAQLSVTAQLDNGHWQITDIRAR